MGVYTAILKGTGVGSVAMALELIYVNLYRGKWNACIPDVSTLSDLDFLYNVNDEAVIFHRLHEKFGANIVEFSLGYRRNMYCFFDYSRLEEIFQWYERFADCPDEVASPPLPTYYALPEDRHIYNLSPKFIDDPNDA